MVSNDIDAINSSVKTIARLQTVLIVLLCLLAVLLLVRIGVAVFICLAKKKSKQKPVHPKSVPIPEKVVVSGRYREEMDLSRHEDTKSSKKADEGSSKTKSDRTKSSGSAKMSSTTQLAKEIKNKENFAVSAGKEAAKKRSTTLIYELKMDDQKMLAFPDVCQDSKNAKKVACLPVAINSPKTPPLNRLPPPKATSGHNSLQDGTKIEKQGDHEAIQAFMSMLNPSVMDFIDTMVDGSVAQMLDNDVITATIYSPGTFAGVKNKENLSEQNSDGKSKLAQESSGNKEEEYKCLDDFQKPVVGLNGLH